MQGEFAVASEIGGKTLTLTKDGVAMYGFFISLPRFRSC
jgi:hypothetical protein